MTQTLQPTWMTTSIWSLSPEIYRLYQKFRLDQPVPKSANSTDPLNEQDVMEMFTFYWPSHILKIQHALSMLFSTKIMVDIFSNSHEINIIDIAVGSATGSLAFSDYIYHFPLQICKNKPIRINYILTDISSACVNVSRKLIEEYYRTICGQKNTSTPKAALGKIHNIIRPFPDCCDGVCESIYESSNSLNLFLICNALDLLLLRKHGAPKTWTQYEFAKYRGGAFQRLVKVREGLRAFSETGRINNPFVFILQEKKFMNLVDFLSPSDEIPVYRPFMMQMGYRPDKPNRPFPIDYQFLAYHSCNMEYEAIPIDRSFDACMSNESDVSDTESFFSLDFPNRQYDWSLYKIS